MSIRTTVLAPLALALALSACGGEPQQEAAGDATADAAGTETAAVAEASPASGPPASYLQCMSCHSVEPGKHGIGPSMAGIVGRKAGTVEGFAYSDELKNSGLTWDEATLDQWLTDPRKLVPGTRMVFAGMPDAARRKELIDYLATLK